MTRTDTKNYGNPATSKTFFRGDRHAVGIVIGIAFLLRLGYLLQISDYPLSNYLIVDAEGFDRWSNRILAGQWADVDERDPGFSPYAMPIYPFFLAGAKAIVGSNWLAIRLIQAAISSVTCGLLYITTRQFQDRSTATVAGLLLAFYPPAIFYDVQIQKGVIGHLALVLLLLSLTKLVDALSKRWSLLSGLSLAIACLERENSLLLIPLIVIFVLLGTTRANIRQRLTSVILVGLGLSAVYGVVAYRNDCGGRGWTLPVGGMGPNFYCGNNPNATGVYGGLIFSHQDSRYERQDARLLAEKAMGRSLSPAEISHYWFTKAYQYIRESPLTWLQLMAWKILLTVHAVELADTEDFYLHSQWSWLLGALSRLYHWGVLMPIAVCSLVRYGRLWRKLWFYPATTAILALSVAIFFVFGRYRYPMVLTLCPLAAPVIKTAYQFIRLGIFQKTAPRSAPAESGFSKGFSDTFRKWPRWRRPLLAGAISAVIVNWPLSNVRHEPLATSYCNVGNVCWLRNNMEGAQYFYEQSITRHPNFAGGYYGLATLYFTRQDYEQAQQLLEIALKLQPDFEEAKIGLARCREKLGK